MPDLPSPDECLTPEGLGELARSLRGDKTQQEVADAVGVHQPHVSRAEAGSAKHLATTRRLIEGLSDGKVEGPFYRVSSDAE